MNIVRVICILSQESRLQLLQFNPLHELSFALPPPSAGSVTKLTGSERNLSGSVIAGATSDPMDVETLLFMMNPSAADTIAFKIRITNANRYRCNRRL